MHVAVLRDCEQKVEKLKIRDNDLALMLLIQAAQLGQT